MSERYQSEVVPWDLVPKVCEPGFRSDPYEWHFRRSGAIALIGTSPAGRGEELADLVARAPEPVEAWENANIWLDTNDPYGITAGNAFAEVAQSSESSRTFTRGINQTLTRTHAGRSAGVPLTEKLGPRFPNIIQHAWWAPEPEQEALARLSALGYRLIGAEAVSTTVFSAMTRAVHTERLPRDFVRETARYLSSLLPRKLDARASFLEFGRRRADKPDSSA